MCELLVPAKESFVPYKNYIGSNIETMDVSTGKRQVLYTDPEIITGAKLDAGREKLNL